MELENFFERKDSEKFALNWEIFEQDVTGFQCLDNFLHRLLELRFDLYRVPWLKFECYFTTLISKFFSSNYVKNYFQTCLPQTFHRIVYKKWNDCSDRDRSYQAWKENFLKKYFNSHASGVHRITSILFLWICLHKLILIRIFCCLWGEINSANFWSVSAKSFSIFGSGWLSSPLIRGLRKRTQREIAYSTWPISRLWM